MPETFDIKQYESLETELHQALGSDCFAYIAPTSIDQKFKQDIFKLEQKILRKLKKEQNKQKILEFNTILETNDLVSPPVILEEQIEIIEPTVYNFLYSQHVLQHIRFLRALPELAQYCLEFFIPPLSVKNTVKFKTEELTPLSSFSINMPFALKKDEQGLFDIKQTVEAEAKYNLIKTKLAGVATLENNVHLIHQKIENFPQWAFFVINHSKEIQALSSELTQIIYDYFMNFAYAQRKQGFSMAEVNKNAAGFLLDIAKRKKLEQLTVFRAEKEQPLGSYVVSVLKNLKIAYPYIKDETLKAFYTHIFVSLSESIMQNQFIMGTFYNIAIREATPQESAITNSEYTVTINAILDSGVEVKDVKEYYAVKLSQDALTSLIQQATRNLKMFNYYI